jgi:hypothetical protein
MGYIYAHTYIYELLYGIIISNPAVVELSIQQAGQNPDESSIRCEFSFAVVAFEVILATFFLFSYSFGHKHHDSVKMPAYHRKLETGRKTSSNGRY